MSGLNSVTRPLVIAVVGSGPRGISVLERIAVRAAAEVAEAAGAAERGEAVAPAEPSAAAGGGAPRPVRVHLIDATEIGAGRVWRTDQDDWFTMNTVISQVTMYSGGPDGGPDRPGAGPSLGEWIAHRHATAGEPALGPDDYASRVRYGQYLKHVHRTIAEHLPSHVELVPVTGRVTALRTGPDDGYLLSLDAAPHLLEADRVVLATGHPFNAPDAFERAMLDFTGRNPGTHYLCGDSAADMALGEDTVPPGSAVGIKGLGLSFYDVMLSLTVGRGGTFRHEEGAVGGGLRYLPSGREPRIVAGSRSGLPIPARGRNQKRPDFSHRALFLTRDALLHARRARGGTGQLDFAEDVLPLLRREIDHVFYVTHVRNSSGREAADAFAEAHAELLRAGRDPGPLRASAGLGDIPPVDLDALARPFGDTRFASAEEFRERLLAVMDEDLAEAELGTLDGPLKSALDVLRDIRNVVRLAVDYGGLLPASHTGYFHGRFLPVNALLSAGPPMARVEQLRALVRQGIVEVAGPGTRFEADDEAGAFRVVSPQVAGSERHVRSLIDARIPTPDLLRDTSPLTRQLVDEGLVRPYVIEGGPAGEAHATGGLEVTMSPFHVVDRSGGIRPDLYALGIPTEHTRWFTQVGSSRPGVSTLFYQDADAIAVDALRPIGAGPAREAAPAFIPAQQSGSPAPTGRGATVGARPGKAS